MAPIITLTTDFGLTDACAAAMKGVVLSANPGTTLVDISRQVQPGAVEQAAGIGALVVVRI